MLEIEGWCTANRGLLSKDEIREAVCSVFEVQPARLYAPRGIREVTDAKHTLVWFICRLNKASYASIATYLHRRDHTTTRNSFHVADGLLQSGEPYFLNKTYRIYQSLKQLLSERV